MYIMMYTVARNPAVLVFADPCTIEAIKDIARFVPREAYVENL